MKNVWDPGLRVMEFTIGKDEKISAMVSTFPMPDSNETFSTGGAAVAVSSGLKEDSNKKYVYWGQDNKLPNKVIVNANQSPYVAPSLKHLIDNTFSEGIKAYYVYYIYRNGKMEREQIDYAAAGEWIRQQIKELRIEEHLSKPSAFTSPGAIPYPINNIEQIAKLEKDLKKWEETMIEWREFQQNSNLDLWLYEQASDATYFWNWFPTLHLNVGTPDEEWRPKIKRMSYLEATCTRKGIMDRYGNINYCVYSRSFGDDESTTPLESSNPEDYIRQTVVQALPLQNPMIGLKERVERQKRNQPKSRTLDYIIPMCIPTPGRFYYSSPSWYTIFRSGIFQYMLAMFYRKAKMLENSNMFKYIIRIDQKYIEWMCAMEGAITEEDQKKVFNAITDRIESFLKSPENTGKTLITVEETIDGKKVEWVRIELIDSPFKGSDVKEEIEEWANVMLFAAGIHPQTVGAIPGKAKVASGSEARELNLLNQLSLFPLKKMLMTPLYVTKSFNDWDEHLFFDIPVHVLTTLDKNKQGVEEMNSSN